MNASLTRNLVAILGAAFLAACGGEAEVESEELVSADETAALESALTGSYALGTTLQATANLNLRTGAGTGYRILLTMPAGSKVSVVKAAPSYGWYNIKFGGTVGWASGSYLKLVAAPASGPRDVAMSRAASVRGFSYWWGHGRWLASGATSSNRGYCSGSCPSCSHSGSYGADCSGFAGKVWGVTAHSDLSVDEHPYSTYNFRYQQTKWYPINRSNAVRADALVYNSNGSGHIVIYSGGNAWGTPAVYECSGCVKNCLYNTRSLSSAYITIRRSGW